MPNVKKTQSSETIQFRIKKIKNMGYYQNHPEELNLNKNKLNEPVNLEVKLSFGFNIDTGMAIRADVAFFLGQKKERKELFGLKLQYEFEILNFSQYVEDGDLKIEDGDLKIGEKKINLPQNVLKNFVGFVISGARGMLVALNSIPEYSHILLPPIHTESLILNNPSIIPTPKNQA